MCMVITRAPRIGQRRRELLIKTQARVADPSVLLSHLRQDRSDVHGIHPVVIIHSDINIRAY